MPPTQPYTLLRVYLANLRKKLEPDPAKPHLLITKPRLGYRLDVPHRSEGVELPALRKHVLVPSHSLKESAK